MLTQIQVPLSHIESGLPDTHFKFPRITHNSHTHSLRLQDTHLLTASEATQSDYTHLEHAYI